MLDDLEGLQALVAVADLGSFSAAGRAMRLSTNAVSHRVAKLEARLGTRLFERTTRLVRTTDAGERVLVRARRVIEELELAERESDAGALQGTVRLSLPPDLGPLVMPDLARLFAASPRLTLELHGRGVPVDPRRDGLDLVVWGGPPARIPPDLTAKRVGSLSWALCASPAYVATAGLPRTPADLSSHRCLTARNPEPERRWRLVGPRGEVETVAVRGQVESDHPSLLLEAMTQGLGVGIRPATEVLRAAARGDWVHVLPGWHFEPIPVALVMPRGRLRAPAVRLVMESLEASLKRLLD